jgi:predicted small metal-binding protein
MKVVHCREVGFDCEGVVRAESEEEVLRQVAEHARTVHNVEVTPDLAKEVKALIKDES